MKPTTDSPRLRSREVIAVIRAFGGVGNVAKAAKTTPQAVYKWRTHVPKTSVLNLYAYAKKENMDNITLELLCPTLFIEKPATPSQPTASA